MPDRGEFRATTDLMLEIIEELRSLELQKRSVVIGTPEFVKLAVRTEEQARLTFRWSQMQLQMAHDAATRLASGERAEEIILTEVQPRHIDRVLTDWREAQLRLEIARPGSPESVAAAGDIERLREEYHVLFEQRASEKPV
jgi:hypothetical protein